MLTGLNYLCSGEAADGKSCSEPRTRATPGACNHGQRDAEMDGIEAAGAPDAGKRASAGARQADGLQRA